MNYKTSFFNKIDTPHGVSGCWIWTGRRDRDGYGQFSKNKIAHRYMWEFVNGPIPKGMFICHTCDVPECVNPAHLFLGSPKDNMVDMVKKGRDRSVGERNPAAKIKTSDVISIRDRIKQGETCTKIAREYKVWPSAISKIKNNQRWAHV